MPGGASGRIYSGRHPDTPLSIRRPAWPRRGGGPAGEDNCPPPRNKCQVELQVGFTPAVTQTRHFQFAGLRGRGEEGVPRGRTTVLPHEINARWSFRPDLLRPSPRHDTFNSPTSVAEKRRGSRRGGQLSSPTK